MSFEKTTRRPRAFEVRRRVALFDGGRVANQAAVGCGGIGFDAGRADDNLSTDEMDAGVVLLLLLQTLGGTLRRDARGR